MILATLLFSYRRKKVELSKRLKCISHYVPKEARVADIGTDHAYLPIYLIKEDIASRVLAMDINKGPLEKAQANINKYLVSEQVTTRLSNGLEELRDDEADAVIIAGMGGMLVASILEKDKEKLENVKRLILQPQSDYSQVRRTLHRLGWIIIEEEALIDNGKYYFIIVCDKGEEHYESQIEYRYGRILGHHKSEVYTKYLSHILEKRIQVLESLKDKMGDAIRAREQILKAEIEEIEQVQRWQK